MTIIYLKDQTIEGRRVKSPPLSAVGVGIFGEPASSFVPVHTLRGDELFAHFSIPVVPHRTADVIQKLRRVVEKVRISERSIPLGDDLRSGKKRRVRNIPVQVETTKEADRGRRGTFA